MKILKIFLLAFFFQFLILINPYKVIAQPPFEDDACGFKVECIDPIDCKTPGTNDLFQGIASRVKFSFDLSKIPDKDLIQKIYPDTDSDGTPDLLETNVDTYPLSPALCSNRGHENLSLNSPNSLVSDERPYIDTSLICPFVGTEGIKSFFLRVHPGNQPDFDLCIGHYRIIEKPIDVKIEVTSTNGLYDASSDWDVKITFADNSQIPLSRKINLDNYHLNSGDPQYRDEGNLFDWKPNPIVFTLKPQSTKPGGEQHTIELVKDLTQVIATATFTVHPIGTFFCNEPNTCVNIDECKYPVAPGEGICQGVKIVCCQPEPSPTPTIDPFCSECGEKHAYKCTHPECVTCPQCLPPSPKAPPPEPLPTLRALCDQVDPQFQGDCLDCMVNENGEYGRTGIWTAVGCISTDLGGFVTEFIYGIGLKFAGAVAFLYFLYGAFLYLTSGGNPEKVAMGKEVIVSSLSGLLLLIFSLFLLKIIAIDILEIPGFVP